MASKYGVLANGGPRQSRGSVGLSQWQGIMKFLNEYKEGMRWLVGNGQRTVLWEFTLQTRISNSILFGSKFLAMTADYVDQSQG